MPKSIQLVRIRNRKYTLQKGIYLELHLIPGVDLSQLLMDFSRVLYGRNLTYTGRVLENPVYFFIYPIGRLSPIDEQDKEALIDWFFLRPEIRAVHAGRVGETMEEYQRSIGYWRGK